MGTVIEFKRPEKPAVKKIGPGGVPLPVTEEQHRLYKEAEAIAAKSVFYRKECMRLVNEYRATFQEMGVARREN